MLRVTLDARFKAAEAISFEKEIMSLKQD